MNDVANTCMDYIEFTVLQEKESHSKVTKRKEVPNPEDYEKDFCVHDRAYLMCQSSTCHDSPKDIDKGKPNEEKEISSVAPMPDT